MKCEWVRENITLHVYGELADDARHELEQHVARCADCAAELKAEQEFHALLSQERAMEPSPNLLAASRMRLQEALETAEQGRFWHRLAFDPANWLRQVRFSPALASAILILGFAGGVGTSYKVFASSAGQVADHERGSGSRRSFDHRHSFHHARAGHQSDRYQVRHGFDAGDAGIVERSAHPATAAVCGAQ